MNSNLLPTVVRKLIRRHQAAVIGAVFSVLIGVWGVMLWSTPEREVQAAPFNADMSETPRASADASPQVTIPYDSLKQRGTPAGALKDTSTRLINPQQPAADTARKFPLPAVDTARKPAAAPADTLRRQNQVPERQPVVPGALPDSSTRRMPGDTTSGMRSADTLHVTLTKADSIRLDSLKKIPPRDSTARIAQFLYKRPASLSALPIAPRGYSMFLKQPTLVQTEVRLDSTGQYVIVRETVGGKDVKLPVRMPLDEYIKQRFKQGITNNFDDLVLKNAETKKRDDLGELLTSFTNIDIPIPANPVFSIFGPPRINLHISGAVDIRAAFRNTSTDQVTTSALGNSRNEPDFAQEVQINVSGTIGDKLNINADWNTQRQFEYENQLKIKYTGYEDEIVQSVEAGNVSLPTNSRFISSSSALFGIKAQFQLGPLKLTAVASQKKGQIQEKSITGGSSELTFEKHAYDYSKNHYFLDTLYRQYYEEYITTRHAPSKLQVKDYEVWITYQGYDLTQTRQGNAYINLDPTDGNPANYDALRKPHTPIPGEEEVGPWIKLVKGKDYTIDESGGFISLGRSVEGLAVAMAYRVEGESLSPGDDQYYGTLTSNERATDSVLVLKLIKPKDLRPMNKKGWAMMMKNYYPLGGTKIQKSGFTLDVVYKRPDGQTTTKIGSTNIIEIMGVDHFSDDGTPNPDGKFDYTPGLTIDEEHGEVIFPSLEPFKQGLIDAFSRLKVSEPDSTYIYSAVYDTTTVAAQNDQIHDRFLITGKTTAGSSNTISLGFNIVEGSVQVLLNGQALTPNVDYTVDYIIGQVIIKNQAALVPGANLQVKFEQNDLFQLASKTLMGLRGDLNLSERTQLGFTMMSLNQQTLSDKVRLGEEPMNNSIYGIDGKTGADLPFLTKMIDALPIINTKEKSDISVFGEAAYMSPDPNTKKSPIPIDDGKSIAYLDDFEGAKRTIPLGVGYGLWHDASPPAYQSNVDSSLAHLIPDNVKIESKARAFWYNALPSDVSITQLYGDKKTVPKGQEQLTVMNLHYDPRQRGEYNYSMNLKNHFGASASVDSVRRNWAGVQRVLSSSALDLVRENVNFIELWVKVDSGRVDTTKKVYIDLGAISEDVVVNGELNTEEKGLPNGILNEGEDNGIDGLTDAQERVTYADFLNANKADFPELEGDPAGDDWSLRIISSDYHKNDYSHGNGTENNMQSEIGKFPDTEDLNHNNTLDRTNSYFEYELNLDTSETNPQRVGGGLNGWYQYRIPLINPKSKVGQPDLSLIEFARLWMTGSDEPFEIRLYDFNLVGNQWEEVKKNDTTFVVSTINIEDNLNYVSPPGVIREQDKTQTDAQVFGNEQSLLLKVNGLLNDSSRHAIKRFYKPLDVFNYKKMRMFMHGSQSFRNDPDNPSAYIVIRFGVDELNCYEYRAPIFPGLDKEPPSPADAPLVWPVSDNIDIDFKSLTAIKQGRDSSKIDKNGFYRLPGSPYAVKGNPDLSKIAFMSIGVENPKGYGEPSLTGEVWINELRLIDVDNTPGWAYAVSANLKLADLATIGFTYSKQDPFFHQLEQPFGSRTTSVNWNLTASISLERFLPSSWAGTSFPFTYSHTEGYSAPKYQPTSADVEINKAAEQQRQLILQNGGSSKDAQHEYERLIFESQTMRIADSYSLPSFRLSMPYDNWMIQDIINKMQFGFTYNTSFDRMPTLVYGKSWNWQATFGYAYTMSPDLFFQPFELFTDVPIMNGLKDVKLFFPITNFSLKLAANRSQISQMIRNQLRPNPTTRNFSASRGLAFGWKLTENGFLNLSGDYSVDIASTLVHLETDSLGRQRGFYRMISSLIMNDQLIGFGIDNSYMQNLNINSRPRVPNVFDINKYLTLNARYGVGYSWSNNLTLGQLGKSTRWNSNLSLGSDLSLKQFVETWWPTPKATAAAAEPQQNTAPTGRRRSRDEDNGVDEKLMQRVGTSEPDTAAVAQEPVKKDTTRVPLGEKLKYFARLIIKTPLLDYDKINMSFTQTNSSTNTGVPGRPGFANFFGRVPFLQDGVMSYGPTWAYQMGLVSDPTANITDVHLQSAFPFIGFTTNDNRNKRAAQLPLGSTLPESFTQNNKLSFKTNRDLWEGARVDLNWTLGWDYSRSQSLHIELDPITGKPIATVAGLTTGGSIERSFFTLPPVLIFSSLKSGIDEVGKQYAKLQDDQSDKRTDDQKLSDAFEKGFETLPFLRKLFGEYMPRMNYALRWDGLEKYSMFTTWATRVSLDHAYQSTFRRSFRSDPSGNQVTESERVMYGFAPLLGLSITFKELMKGNMSANIRYSSTASYDLSPAAKNIAESGSREISVTASYGRTGFEIPFFGLALNNDVDISFSYSYSKNSRTTYSTSGGKFDATGTPGEGSSRTTMEPRIKYVLSQRVTASLFYRYTKIAPDAGGSRIPGSSTNEGGLDVHIAIQ